MKNILGIILKKHRIPGDQGFSLVESLIALFILSLGLLAVAQMLLVSLSSPTLARSKSSAALVAQDKLEFLAAAYRQDPAHADLTLGNHGPDFVNVNNPNDARLLNRYAVNWNISQVPDPRAWKTLHAIIASVTVTPVDAGGNRNDQQLMNKVVSVTTTLSTR